MQNAKGLNGIRDVCTNQTLPVVYASALQAQRYCNTSLGGGKAQGGGRGVLRRLTSRSENKNQNRTVTFVSWLCDHDFRLKHLRKKHAHLLTLNETLLFLKTVTSLHSTGKFPHYLLRMRLAYCQYPRM